MQSISFAQAEPFPCSRPAAIESTVGSNLWVLLAHSVQQLAERFVHFAHVLDAGCICMGTHVSSPEWGAETTDAFLMHRRC